MKLFFPGIFFSTTLFFAAESTAAAQAQTAQILEPTSTYISQTVSLNPQILWTQANTSTHQDPHPILHAIASMLGFNHAPSHSATSFTRSTSNHSNFSTNSSSLSTASHGFSFGGFLHGIVSAIGNGVSHIANAISGGIHYVTRAIKATQDLTGIFNLLTKLTLGRAIGDVINKQNYEPAPLIPSAEVMANAAGKIPVVLVPGGFSNSDTLLPYYNSFEKAGIPTYVPTLGNGPHDIAAILDPSLGGTDYIDDSARQLSNFVDAIQKDTGSPKVDLVAISQGGLIARDYLVHDQKDNIESVANMGGAEHGSTLSGIVQDLQSIPKPLANIYKNVLGAIDGPANIDLMNDSPLVQELNKYPDTKPGINYLDVSSDNDIFVSPGEKAGFLTAGPGAKVTNIEVHTIPGVPADFNHLQFATMQPVIDKAVQYIQENGQTGPGVLGVTRTPTVETSGIIPAASITPTQKQQAPVTIPTVSLLG